MALVSLDVNFTNKPAQGMHAGWLAQSSPENVANILNTLINDPQVNILHIIPMTNPYTASVVGTHTPNGASYDISEQITGGSDMCAIVIFQIL